MGLSGIDKINRGKSKLKREKQEKINRKKEKGTPGTRSQATTSLAGMRNRKSKIYTKKNR